MRLVKRRRINRADGSNADPRHDDIVEEVWEDRPPVPAQAPPGVDPYAVGIAAGIVLGLASLVLVIILLASPGSFGIATEEQVENAARAAAAPGPRGPAGPPGPRGERGPAGVADDGRLAEAASDAAAARAVAERLDDRIAEIGANVAALCAAQPAAC